MIWPATLAPVEPVWVQLSVAVAPALATEEARLIGSGCCWPAGTLAERVWVEPPGTASVHVTVARPVPVFEAYASPSSR